MASATQGIGEGECGRPNPLTQISRHLTGDPSNREDFLAHGTSMGHERSRLSEPVSLHPADVLFEEFLLSEQRQRLAPETFHMNDLLNEMLAIDAEEHRETMVSGPIRGPTVSEIVARGSARWAEEFLQNDDLVIQHSNSSSFGSDPLLLDDARWSSEYLSAFEEESSSATAATTPVSPADWIKAFESQNPELTRTTNELLGTLEEPKFSDVEFLKFVKQFGDGEIKTGPDRQQLSEEFPASGRVSVADRWVAELEAGEGRTGEAADETQVGAAAWSSEFSSSHQAESDAAVEENAAEFWEKLQREWEKAGAKADSDWFQTFDQVANRRENYVFDDNNPFKDFIGDAIEEGRSRLRRGDLANAILLFESAVQKDPNNPEAWQLLGTSQAENEQEPASIAALRKCVELSPKNLTAWMALAVSYTNESLYKQGCDALRRWFEANDKYRHVIVDSGSTTSSVEGSSDAASSTRQILSSIFSPTEHQEIRSRFIEAVKETTARGEFDFELQSGLGVLFNISGEYDKAVDCFQAALKARPDDAALWNRLGATLANGNRSEEAVEAYNRALRLSPGFVRCRYNLGIACVNLSAYRQAVEHLLTALHLQSTGIGPVTSSRTASMSENIWSTLRLAASLMGRHDLLPLVNQKNIESLNREFGIKDAVGALF